MTSRIALRTKTRATGSLLAPRSSIGHPVAYHSRGDARQRKGDLDTAIVDFTKAIEINPALARAYESRGRAYASKGDYTRAVADVTKASELAAKLMPTKGATSS